MDNTADYIDAILAILGEHAALEAVTDPTTVPLPGQARHAQDPVIFNSPGLVPVPAAILVFGGVEIGRRLEQSETSSTKLATWRWQLAIGSESFLPVGSEITAAVEFWEELYQISEGRSLHSAGSPHSTLQWGNVTRFAVTDTGIWYLADLYNDGQRIVTRP